MNWGFRTPSPATTGPVSCPSARPRAIRPLAIGVAMMLACAFAPATPAFGTEATITAGQAFAEGNGGPNVVLVEITLDAVAVAGDTIDVATTSGGSATASDFTALSATTVPFAAGDLTATVALTINGENVFEPNETVQLELSNGTGSIAAVPASPIGTVTITNDDLPPTISINDVSLGEGNAGTTDATFTVTLSNPSQTAITVTRATADVTAVAPSDYTALGAGTVTFNPLDVSQPVVVSLNGDSVFEDNETFFVELTSPTGATILDTQGLGTITNDDAQPTISIANAPAVTEGNAGTINATFTVTLSNPSQAPITVTRATANGTASAPGDYSALGAGTLTFNSLDVSEQVVVAVNGDTTYETAETFVVNLSAASGATIADAQGLGTITNDDAAPTISINNVAVAEGAVANFTVTRAGNATEVDVTANFVVNDGGAVAPGDYLDTSGSISIPAGGSAIDTISVTTVNNAIFEGDETFTVVLSGATNATITTATGTATIDDTADTPTLSLSSFSTFEAGGIQPAFRVTRSGASDIATTVTFSTGGGTATAGADYNPQTGITVSVPAGGSGSFDDVNLDILDEAIPVYEGVETIGGTIGLPTNANLGITDATAAISDATDAPTLTISGLTIAEEPAGAQAAFTVTRTGLTNIAATVTLNTANVTATATTDYTAVSGALVTIDAAGPTGTETILVTTLNDAPEVFEGNELFSATLSGATDATIASTTANATITDVADTPTLAITGATVTEAGGSQVAFTVTRTGASNLAATATLNTANATAAAGSDYTALSAFPVSIAPSLSATATQLINVSVLDDAPTNVFEGDETFTATISGSGNATIPAPGATATTTITDAGDTPSLSIADVTFAEGGVATFTVTRTGATNQPTSATYAVNDGTAVSPDDYADTTGTVTIGAGGTGTFTVTTADDNVFEGNETFTALISAPVNATILDGNGLGTITDAADTPNVTISNATAAEGSPANFVVSLSVPSTLAVQVTYTTANASATAPGDYTAATAATVTFPAGTNADQPIAITTVQDTIDELDETFQVNLSAPTGGATIADAQGISTITDDDTASITLADVAVTEGNTQLAPATAANFSASLSTTSDRPITVNFATSDGTAVLTDDYTNTASSIVFPANSAATQTITIPVRGDLLDEDAEATPSPLADETFTVTLSTPTNGALIADGVATGTITDDDATPTLSIVGTTVAEGTGVATTPATFAVTLSAPSALPVIASFTTTDATAVSTQNATSLVDFTAVGAGSVSIPAGATTPTIPATVQVAQDNVDEVASETFTVTLATPENATLTTATATGTITDDDAAPTISIDDLTATEGNTGTTAPTFTVTLSNPSFQQVSVTYATANGTATTPADYTQVVGTILTINPLLTTAPAPVQVIGDVLDEADLDTAFVNLALPTNGTIGDAQGILNIADDDALPTVAFSPTSTELHPEGNAGVSVKNLSLQLNVPSGRTVTVVWETADIAAFAPNATANIDYVQAAPTVITFTAGQTIKPVPITVIGDVDGSEGSESVGIQLSNPGNGTLPSPQKHLLIIEDDTVNIPPFATADTLVVNRNAAGTVNVRTNDVDANGDALVVPGNTQPAHGTAFCQSTGACLYTPTAGYSGPDSFTYTLSDGQAGATGTVNVNVVNATPVTAPDALVTGQGTPASVNVVANDSDPDGVSLTVTNGTDGLHGTASCVAGSCTYVPTLPSYIGPDTFTYTLTDADGATAVGTVNVTVGRGKPLTFTAKAGSAKSKVGARNGYTLTLKNPNGSRVKVTSISVCIPKGFKYVPGSASGAFKKAPTKSSCAGGAVKLSWGKVTVPANGSIVQRFKVTVGGAPKTVKITAIGKALEKFVITPLKPSAPIKVTAK